MAAITKDRQVVRTSEYQENASQQARAQDPHITKVKKLGSSLPLCTFCNPIFAFPINLLGASHGLANAGSASSFPDRIVEPTETAYHRPSMGQ